MRSWSRAITALAIAAILALPSVALATPDPGDGTGEKSPPPRKTGTVGTVVSSAVKVYSGPGTSHSVKHRLTRGTRVHIACQARGTGVDGPRARNWPWWNRITSPVWGWVSDAFIDSGPDERAAPDCPGARQREKGYDHKPSKRRPKKPAYPYPRDLRVNEGRPVTVPTGVHDADQCAFGEFWPEAKYIGDIGVSYCWQWTDDTIYVQDSNEDNAASAVYYQYYRRNGDLHTQVDRAGLCINSHGNGTWAKCALRIRGQDRKIKLYGALLDRDGNHEQEGLWTTRTKDSTFVTTDPTGIECSLAAKGIERCEPVGENAPSFKG